MQSSTSWPFQESAEEGNDQQGESSQPGCIRRRKIFNSWHGWPPVQDWRHDTSAHISGPWRTSDSDFGLNDALQLNLVKLDKAVYEVDADAEDVFRQQVVTEYADLFDDQQLGWCGRLRSLFKSLGSRHIRTSPFFYLVATICETHSVGSVSRTIAPFFTILPDSSVTFFSMAWGIFLAGFTTGMTLLSTLIVYLAANFSNDHTIPCVLQMMWPPDCGMRRSFQRWMQRLDFGRSSSKSNPLYVQRSVHHMGGTCFSACPLASTQHQKCSSKPYPFKGYPCAIIVDDILIWGSAEGQHDPTSRKSSRELDRLAWSWTSANASSVREASASWDTRSRMKVWSLTEKRDTIRNMPAPENQAAVQRFLRMTNYLNKFIKDTHWNHTRWPPKHPFILLITANKTAIKSAHHLSKVVNVSFDDHIRLEQQKPIKAMATARHFA